MTAPGGGSVFNQPNWTVTGDVYNVAGSLTLTKTSTRYDFLAGIDAARAEIQSVPIPHQDRQEILGDLHRVAEEAQSDRPSKDTVTSLLGRMTERLKSLGSVAKEALQAAASVAALAAWAAQYF